MQQHAPCSVPQHAPCTVPPVRRRRYLVLGPAANDAGRAVCHRPTPLTLAFLSGPVLCLLALLSSKWPMVRTVAQVQLAQGGEIVATEGLFSIAPAALAQAESVSAAPPAAPASASSGSSSPPSQPQARAVAACARLCVRNGRARRPFAQPLGLTKAMKAMRVRACLRSVAASGHDALSSSCSTS